MRQLYGLDKTARIWDTMPRPYEGLNIRGAMALIEAQRHSLKALRAVIGMTT